MMNTIGRIRAAWRQGRDGGGGNPPDLIQRTIDRESERIRGTDPETDRQWKRLAVGLEHRTNMVASRRYALRPRLALTVASAAALVIAAASLLLVRDSAPVVYETSRGEQSVVRLSDSSEVTLNNTSQLVVLPRHGAEARTVALTGEAFFRVRKNGAPFVVTTAAGRVEVLGTEFNVRVRDEDLAVGVTRGTVRVSTVRDGRESALILTAGQFAVSERGAFQGPPERLPTPDYPGWMHGRLVFMRASLPSVCREIESRFDVRVTLSDPRLNHTTVTGSVDAATVERAVSTIASLTGTKYRHENGAYILY